MAGKNEKVDFMHDINSMLSSQKEENEMLRKKAKREGDKPAAFNEDREKEIEESPIMEPNKKEKKETRPVGRPKVSYRLERKKVMNVFLDLNTHKALGLIKLEHSFEMRDVAYIAIRKFLDEYMEDYQLSEDGIAFLQKKLEELKG